MHSPSFIAAAACAVALVAGCTLHPGEAWNRTDGEAGPAGAGSAVDTGADATDQSPEGLCPATSPLLAGRAAAGEVCSVAADCVSTCCDCGTGSQSWLAASCVAGRCEDSLTSCSRTNARYCTGGGGGVIVVAPPGGQCGGGAATTGCEACVSTSCCAESLACSQDPACAALEVCDGSCAGEAECRERCYETSGGGALALQSLDACVARACGAACEP
ncbi:MAG: hypothetical protein JWP97_6487 [Labilithrix sp.]|nr:hypothetical protein [Labilithrix sp.]